MKRAEDLLARRCRAAAGRRLAALVISLGWLLALPLSAAVRRSVLVGYFPQWGVYHEYFVKNLITSGAVAALDQLDYSQGVIVDNRCAIADPNADLNLVHTAENSVDGKGDEAGAPLRGNFHQLQELRQRYPKLKMLISLEGRPEGFAAAARPEHRAAFVSSCIDMFLRGRLAPGVDAGKLFDGFDIDWEIPTLEQKEDYLNLLAEFRRQMDALRPGMRLTIALAAGRDHYQGFDLKTIAALTDEVNVMNYDYNGPWSHLTGILAPLYEIAGDPLRGNNIDASIQAYEDAGVPAAKLLLGIPFYAYGWSAVSGSNHGLFQPGQPIHGDHFYSYIQSILPNFTLYRDPHSETPWLYDGKTFWTFDDPVSIRVKLDYARQHKLGGAMVWELSNDSVDAVLLKTIATELSDWPRKN